VGAEEAAEAVLGMLDEADEERDAAEITRPQLARAPAAASMPWRECAEDFVAPMPPDAQSWDSDGWARFLVADERFLGACATEVSATATTDSAAVPAVASTPEGTVAAPSCSVIADTRTTEKAKEADEGGRRAAVSEIVATKEATVATEAMTAAGCGAGQRGGARARARGSGASPYVKSCVFPSRHGASPRYCVSCVVRGMGG